MNTKTPECYTTDSQARCLRVETSTAHLLVLPLDQFVFAELTSDEHEQKLRLVFATHEVLISGHVLQRIATAVHRLELSGIVKLPEKCGMLIGEGQPKVRDIVIKEMKASEAEGQNAPN